MHACVRALIVRAGFQVSKRPASKTSNASMKSMKASKKARASKEADEDINSYMFCMCSNAGVSSIKLAQTEMKWTQSFARHECLSTGQSMESTIRRFGCLQHICDTQICFKLAPTNATAHTYVSEIGPQPCKYISPRLLCFIAKLRLLAISY